MKKLLIIMSGLLLCPQLIAMSYTAENRLTVINESGRPQFIAFSLGDWNTDLGKMGGKFLDIKESFSVPEKSGIVVIPTTKGLYQVSLSESTKPRHEPLSFALGQMTSGQGGLFNQITKRLSPDFGRATITIEKDGSVSVAEEIRSVGPGRV